MLFFCKVSAFSAKVLSLFRPSLLVTTPDSAAIPGRNVQLFRGDAVHLRLISGVGGFYSAVVQSFIIFIHSFIHSQAFRIEQIFSCRQRRNGAVVRGDGGLDVPSV